MSDTGGSDWIIGVAIRLGGAAALNLGMLLMKASHAANDALSASERKGCLRQTKWLVGLCVLISGHLLTFASLSFASQGLMAVLGSFSLVTNIPFSAWLLGETFNLGHAVSTVLLIAGSAVAVLFSSHADQDWTEESLVALFGEPGFFVVAAAYAGLVAVAVAWQRQLERAANGKSAAAAAVVRGDVEMGSARSNSPTTPSSAMLSKEAASPAEERSKRDAYTEAAPDEDAPRSLAPPLGWLCAAAIGGALSFLFAKCLSQAVRAWPGLGADASAGEDAPWAFAMCSLLGVAVSGGGSLWAMNYALRRGRAGFVIPFYFAAHTCLTMVLGVVFFKEYELMTGGEAAMLALGVVMTVHGVLIGHRADSEGAASALRLAGLGRCRRCLIDGEGAPADVFDDDDVRGKAVVSVAV
mmetsp:Transcript_17114/g.60046  ORF Transcript_17114/g.60046 Transcript_17114/m.60046 type:complete len:412 (-) Transcript_17114:1145-2380(-)